ncbi:MAG: GrpB family protein [Dehalococcoidia bacterium]|nr:GrpB family protein [Dehalococcoidia bacterium]
MTRRVELVPYNPDWPRIFTVMRRRILERCDGLVVDVEHIGSTSVPGLAAKDVVDLMPGLRAFDDGAKCVPAMESLGFVYKGEFGIPGRHYFNMDDPETGKRLHNCHMYAIGHDEWIAHLAFRHYLRGHADWRDRYEALKRHLAVRHRDDVEAYAEAKTDFVKQVVALSLAKSGSDHSYRRIR